MRQAWKYLPTLYGVLLGWILFNPPAWLDALGPWAWLVNGAIVLLLLVSFVPVVVLANLPRALQVDPAPDAPVPHELVAIRERLVRLGFRQVDGPFTVQIAPPALLLGFVHEREPIYATAFRTDSLPPRIASDFASILHGDVGGLTTGADAEGAALDGGAASLRQVLPGAEIDALFAAHVDGLSFLRERGLSPRTASVERFVDDLRLGFACQRRQFTATPLRSTVITFWRTATKRVPFVGPLREQAIARRQIVSILSGRTNPVDAIG